MAISFGSHNASQAGNLRSIFSISLADGSGLSWFGIIRLGAVQAAIGAIVMLTTSLLNRLMVVEYGVAAAIPAALVAWHYGVQLSRPLWGHKSDQASQRSSWIIAGLAILVIGSLLAVNVTIMMTDPGIKVYLWGIISFALIGLGVGMSGTALLALLASRVSDTRKPAAAAICWTMMVAGIVVAAGVTGALLEPFSEARLALIASAVALAAFLLAAISLANVENNSKPVNTDSSRKLTQSFQNVLQDIWQDDEARRFTFFVFMSMLAYSMQDLILEPFAGFLFEMTPGQSTQLAGVQHSGVLAGMLLAGLGGSLYTKKYGKNLKLWIVGGCAGSALMLAGLSMAAGMSDVWPLRLNVFGLGLANGVFAVAAVSAMLGLASEPAAEGQGSREGARMGVWGAAQAIGFGLGGLLGAVIVDLLRSFTGENVTAFQIVFAIEAVLFVAAALVATGTSLTKSSSTSRSAQHGSDTQLGEVIQS